MSQVAAQSNEFLGLIFFMVICMMLIFLPDIIRSISEYRSEQADRLHKTDKEQKDDE